MSKAQKIFITIAMMILSILVICTISKAEGAVVEYPADPQIGKEVLIGYNLYSDGIKAITGDSSRDAEIDKYYYNNLFCIQHGQSFGLDLKPYRYTRHFRIEGLVATDMANGVQTDPSEYNAKLAYILSQDFGEWSENAAKINENLQHSLWTYLRYWKEAVDQWFKISEIPDGQLGDGSGDNIDREADEYAEQLKQFMQSGDTYDGTIEDETIKESLTVKTSGKYITVGPFTWTFTGTLSNVEVKDGNNVINNVKYGKYNGNSLEEIEEIQSGVPFYILIPKGTSASSISSITVGSNIRVYNVDFWILENSVGWQTLLYRENWNPEPTTDEIQNEFEYNIDLKGSIKIYKVNEDNHDIGLPGVGFIIKRCEIEEDEFGNEYEVYTYVHEDRDGNISYVENRDRATEFVTDDTGTISIEDLTVGTYIAYETENPNYGYEVITDGIEFDVNSKKTKEITITNKQIYVKLSGYVWLDVQSGKQSTRNSLYRNDYNDDEDELLEGVIVRLINRRTGRIVRNDDGEDFYAETEELDLGDRILRYYQFVDVRIEDLDEYAVQFEYDGLTYTNVIPNIDVDNGSKAAENPDEREEFDLSFSTIMGVDANNGVALDPEGNVKHELSYKNENHTSTLNNNGLPVGQFPITANTDETDYDIRDNFEWGMEEIPYINLGLYLREQPDLAVIKDIDNVRLSINGYNHIYKYAKRFENLEEQLKNNEETGFNVGVKFGSEYMQHSYTRAIYRADYEYKNDNDTSKELQVYVTYRIAVRNESTNLLTRVNSLVDYYDSEYVLQGVGTGIKSDGSLTGEYDEDDLTIDKNYDNNGYSKVIITTNSLINAESQNNFYVQFKLSRDAVVDILSNKEKLDNVVEVYSYSTYSKPGAVEGKSCPYECPYAGVDVDSNPGNADPADTIDGTYTTFEDDTDRSPSLQLEVKDARRMTGTVFEDETFKPEEGQNPDEVMTGHIRQGNSTYDSDEPGIGGVDVTLKENVDSNGMTYKTTTVSQAGWYDKSEIKHTYTDTSGNLVTVENEEDNYGTYVTIPAGRTITVTLPAVTTTNPNDEENYVYLNIGDFYIDDYVPGEYELTYTWGDETYQVQNYKGTVYDKTRYDSNYDKDDGTKGNREWYKNDVDIRYTDAVDNYTTREKIDSYFKEVNNGTLRGIDYTNNEDKENHPTTMDSTTPIMGICIEYEDNRANDITKISDQTFMTDSDGDELVTYIKNIDFGIIERAKQDINLTKRIRTMKVTLANGQTLVNLTVGEDGKLSGQTSNVIYLGPSENNEPKNGLIRLEMDSELIEGSKLEIGYELKVENNSEKDYATEDYYKYGIITENEEGLVTISPTILDYLDNDWDFSTDTNTNNWESAIKEDGQVVFVDSTGKTMPPLSTDTINAIKDQKILFTDDLKNIKPADSASVALNVSKILTSSGDITLDNSAEVVQIDKPGGSEPEIEVIPGDYEPGSNPEKHDDDWSETTIITPNTGEDLNYIVPIVVIVTAFAIVGVGVIFIKKKVLNK